MQNSIIVSDDSEKNLTVISRQNVLEKDFTVYGSVENPLFLEKDVAEWIDYTKTSKGAFDVSNMLKSIDEDEKLVRTIFVSGQNRECSFVTENGLYEILMLSRKPIAKQFKKEVKKILHELRTNGGYIVGQENLSDEQLMAKALVVAQNVIAKKDAVIEEMKPKAEYFDSYCDASNLEEIGHLGKVTKIGEQKIFKVLVADGYIKVRYSTDDVKSYDPCFGYEKYFETIHVPFLRGDKQLSRDKLMLNHKGFMYFRSKYASKEELLETAENYMERAINNCPECNNTYIDKFTSNKIKTYSYSEVAAEAGEDEQTIINFCKAKGWIDANNNAYEIPDFDYYFKNRLTDQGKNYILATFLKIKNSEKGIKKTTCGKGE